MRKEKRYGGAERAWDVRAELPILLRWVEGLVSVRYRVREEGDVWRFILFYYCGEKDGERAECYVAAEEHAGSQVAFRILERAPDFSPFYSRFLLIRVIHWVFFCLQS